MTAVKGKVNVQKQKRKQESEALLTFLKRTKKGEYAEVERNSLRYSRVSEEAETVDPEEDYFYNLN